MAERETYIDQATNALTKEQLKLKQLYYWSFYFSQGSREELQYPIFKWLLVKGYITPDTLEKNPHFIEAITAPKLHDPFGKEKNISTVSETVGTWQDLYNFSQDNGTVKKSEHLVARIAQQTIRRDLEYQYRERPGRDVSKPFLSDSANDPHKSFIRKYVINRTPTAMDAYTQLYTEIGTYLAPLWNIPSSPIPSMTFYEKDLDTRTNEIQLQISSMPLPEAASHLIREWEINHKGESFFETARTK